MPKIQAVFFDYGSTLIYPKDPWFPIYEQADQAMLEAINIAGIPIERKAFSSQVGTFLDAYTRIQHQSIAELTTPSFLAEVLSQMGSRDVPPSVQREALDALYAITQRNWVLEEDAVPTLEILKDQGYLLGMISNTSDDKNVQQLIDRDRLRPYFKTLLTSAGCGIRKPDDRIFRLALDDMQLSPDQACMVGDTLEEDILGANKMGIYSIWITRRVRLPEDGELKIQPQAVVTALDQIPDLLKEIKSYTF